MKTVIILILALLAIIFTGGIGLILIVAIWTIAYIAQLHHGAAKFTPDGKPNPRARGRAPDDESHWFAEDGCGPTDTMLHGADVVAKRRAFRERWEADAGFRNAAEEVKRRVEDRGRVFFVLYCGLSSPLS